MEHNERARNNMQRFLLQRNNVGAQEMHFPNKKKGDTYPTPLQWDLTQNQIARARPLCRQRTLQLSTNDPHCLRNQTIFLTVPHRQHPGDLVGTAETKSGGTMRFRFPVDAIKLFP